MKSSIKIAILYMSIDKVYGKMYSLIKWQLLEAKIELVKMICRMYARLMIDQPAAKFSFYNQIIIRVYLIIQLDSSFCFDRIIGHFEHLVVNFHEVYKKFHLRGNYWRFARYTINF